MKIPFFSPSPSPEVLALRDALASSHEQIQYLRSQLSELQRINVALTNSQVAKYLYPTSPVTSTSIASPASQPPSPFSPEMSTPFQLRNSTLPKPSFSLSDIETRLKKVRED